MLYRTLGTTGVTVSVECLGSMLFGQLGNTDVDDCLAIIGRVLDNGINVLDTADVYSGGQSDRSSGRRCDRGATRS